VATLLNGGLQAPHRFPVSESGGRRHGGDPGFPHSVVPASNKAGPNLNLKILLHEVQVLKTLTGKLDESDSESDSVTITAVTYLMSRISSKAMAMHVSMDKFGYLAAMVAFALLPQAHVEALLPLATTCYWSQTSKGLQVVQVRTCFKFGHASSLPFGDTSTSTRYVVGC
jgi:hypothetical protein